MSKRRSKNKKPLAKEESYVINIFRTDMSDELQKEAVTAAKEAFSESKVQKDISAKIKKKFDNLFPNTTWHCIVGQHFAVSVTHQTKYLIFFSCNGQSILLFKTQE